MFELENKVVARFTQEDLVALALQAVNKKTGTEYAIDDAHFNPKGNLAMSLVAVENIPLIPDDKEPGSNPDEPVQDESECTAVEGSNDAPDEFETEQPITEKIPIQKRYSKAWREDMEVTAKQNNISFDPHMKSADLAVLINDALFSSDAPNDSDTSENTDDEVFDLFDGSENSTTEDNSFTLDEDESPLDLAVSDDLDSAVQSARKELNGSTGHLTSNGETEVDVDEDVEVNEEDRFGLDMFY